MRNYLLISLPVVVAVLTACVSTTITENGTNSFIAEARAPQDWTTLDEVQTKNYAAADNFCRADDKRMNFVSITSLQKPIDKDADVENYSRLIFKCSTPKLPY